MMINFKKNKRNKKNTLDISKKIFKHIKPKYLVPISVFIFLLFAFLGFRIVPAMLANNVYNINDLNGNLSQIKEGDIVNYEINGYSKWRVINIDKENGTIEVTSDSNVYDLTLEPYKSIDEYKAIFQSEADKFTNDEHVVDARTIAKSDSLKFDTKGEYWLANINENSLMTNLVGDQESQQIIYKSNSFSGDVYVWPYVEKYENSSCSIGSTKSFSSKSWICKKSYRTYNYGLGRYMYRNSYFVVDPLLVSLNLDNMGYVFNDFANSVGDYDFVSFYGYNSLDYNFNYDANLKDDYLKSLAASGPIYIANNVRNINKSESDRRNNSCIEKKYKYECDGKIEIVRFNPDGSHDSLYVGGDIPKTLTFGYRPVLTLKFDIDEDGKDTNDNLKIGDNVKYEANGYRNWKVLSINELEGTVDIISGGIVKNISLYGTNDYNNYESILQEEVNSYRNGKNVIDARPVSADDVDLLINMKDSVSAMYWYNIKNLVVRDSGDAYLTNSVSYDNSYEVGILWTNTGDYYINDINSNSSPYLRKYWVSLFSNGSDMYSNDYYIGTGNLNYIAGLRPVITLKYDNLKKLSSVQARKLNEESQTYDMFYSSEQYSNNSQKNVSKLLYSNDGKPVYDTIYNNNSELYFNNDDSIKNNVCEYKVNMGDTEDVLHLAIILSIIYGIIVACFTLYVIAYKYKVGAKK